MWARARVWADRYFLRKYIGRRHGGWVSSRGSCLKRGESKRGGVNSELRIRCFIINSTVLLERCLNVKTSEETRWKEGKASDLFRESDDRDSLSRRILILTRCESRMESWSIVQRRRRFFSSLVFFFFPRFYFYVENYHRFMCK